MWAYSDQKAVLVLRHDEHCLYLKAISWYHTYLGAVCLADSRSQAIHLKPTENYHNTIRFYGEYIRFYGELMVILKKISGLL